MEDETVLGIVRAASRCFGPFWLPVSYAGHVVADGKSGALGPGRLTALRCPHRDSMDSVKQSAALCLLRLYKASPDLVPMGEWTARVVHLLNDQHMVRCPDVPKCLKPLVYSFALTWNVLRFACPHPGSEPGPSCLSFLQGVVTAAVSLITCLCKKNPDDFKTCISLAVSRLSRVSLPSH